jgi:hypothetical protein
VKTGFFGVILSEAKNLSVHWIWSEERFFASLRMTPGSGFSAACEILRCGLAVENRSQKI